MGAIGGRLHGGALEDEKPVVLPVAFEALKGVAPNEDIARWLRRHYPCGVAVVTAAADGEYFGVTVSAFSFISLEPLLVLVALGNESLTGEHIRQTKFFAVSMLTNRQRFLADRFAARAPLVDRRFEEVPHVVAVTGCPLLLESMSWLDCSLETVISGGDHHVYIGRAVAVGHGTGDESDPLLYFASEYRRLS